MHYQNRTVFKCNCGKSFEETNSHVITKTTQITNANCEPCDKSFSSRQHLTEHIHAIHESRKEYQCESCEKSFSKTDNLKKFINN